jgi:hypothetical protein
MWPAVLSLNAKDISSQWNSKNPLTEIHLEKLAVLYQLDFSTL